jgi:hypothetical protein
VDMLINDEFVDSCHLPSCASEIPANNTSVYNGALFAYVL